MATRKASTAALKNTESAKTTKSKPWFGTVPQRKNALTIALGVGIPLASLVLSSIAGHHFANGNFLLAGFAMLLMAAVLGVSLPHLADAIQDITRSVPRASILLAVALDLMLVLGELTLVLSPKETGIGTIVSTVAMMIVVAGFSMALNCWAFFRCHAEKPTTSSETATNAQQTVDNHRNGYQPAPLTESV